MTDCLCHGSCLSMPWSADVPTKPRLAVLAPLANKGRLKRKAGSSAARTLWTIPGTLPRNRSFLCFTSAKEMFHAPR